MQIRVALAALLACGLALAAPSPSRVIAGITLGDPPPFPECATVKVKNAGGYKDFLTYADHPLDQQCWQRSFMDPRMGQPPGAEREEVKAYVTTPLPTGLSSYIQMVLIDGRVEEIRIDTRGKPWQSDILAALTEKYGKPTYSARTPVQNRMGAQYESLDARWEFSDMEVSFYGLTKLDAGKIRIRTAAQVAKDHAPQPKL
jgi:hypothetical protein